MTHLKSPDIGRQARRSPDYFYNMKNVDSITISLV